ncbi:response regulator transcription factor [candidate division CSSED10-310 bacterium]|uniref:Response regulator transcription factor n=1 Tax=candidate division CSSED10-310 bacterium TaxID=2855610 RepID=A0ABV6Z4X5_UNCC1
MKILIAEDDRNILEGLAEIFEGEGYKTVKATNGQEALRLFKVEKPDFVCLDIMMPGMSGYDICREIRTGGSDIPVIFISAKSEEIDKVLGLELGADDYIVKPFGVREVVARIRAVTRRYLAAKKPAPSFESFRIADLEVFPDELRARRGAQSIELSLRDITILKILHRNKGKVVNRQTFFRQVWDLDHIPLSRTLDQHISQLRKRIEIDPTRPAIISTIHGVGYRYDEP